MRNRNTEAELQYIPNVSFKRDAICQNYMKYCSHTDIQGYFSEQLELNENLLAWLFDDNSLIGKTPTALDEGLYEAFVDFYESLNVYDD